MYWLFEFLMLKLVLYKYLLMLEDTAKVASC